jgi:hypothetical protein
VNRVLLPVIVALGLSCAGTSTSPKVAAGQNALIDCAAKDFIGMLGDVASALMADDYDQKLQGIGSKNELRKDAVACAVKAVDAVVTAKPEGAGSGASTSRPSAIAIHAASFLADKHFAESK